MTANPYSSESILLLHLYNLCILADMCPFVLSLEQSGIVGSADLIGEDESSFEQPVFMKSADFTCRSVPI